MNPNHINLTPHCVVSRKDTEEQRGIVVQSEGVDVCVHWQANGQASWVKRSELVCGFQAGDPVMRRAQQTYPIGQELGHVIALRTLGGFEQVLVEFDRLPNRAAETMTYPHRLWVRYEELALVTDAVSEYMHDIPEVDDSAERFRLRALATAIRAWDHNTGSFSHLDIDPLPHQIHLVHHILKSGNLNWLIADDVGLGKTIEVGMLLGALRRRGIANRILVVTPAGLTTQWQEAMGSKFGLDEFQIYGKDFEINQPNHWRLHDHVIASIDRLKHESHLTKLQSAGQWDIIVFDEAHRLTRRERGMQRVASDRYKLAHQLRAMTPSLVMLSATPHSGSEDVFKGMLELLRPELTEQIRALDLNRDILKHIVIRNRKSDVTNAEGQFIFQGYDARLLPVPVPETFKSFDTSLQSYIRQGYAASHGIDQTRLPIGFVMTTYRKLASSSLAAIHRALERRLERLDGSMAHKQSLVDAEDRQERHAGEHDEDHEALVHAKSFFKGEREQLRVLVHQAASLLAEDPKLEAFMNQLMEPISSQSPDEKVLIFTEYRATQAQVAKALEKRFGSGSVSLINGLLDVDARNASIRDFEHGDARFLISTESGAEGINLQRSCHLMVNYDLPWNPMRLVQRIGRLYRYGQTKRVKVFNIRMESGIDEKIVQTLWERLETVSRDLATVGGEFRDGTQFEILGDLAEFVDVNSILGNNAAPSIQRSFERIEDALERAKSAAELQREILSDTASYNPQDLAEELAVEPAHLHALIEGMAPYLNYKVLDHVHRGKALIVELGEELRTHLNIRKTRLALTADRLLAAQKPNLESLDMESPLVRYIIEQATDYYFQGRKAKLKTSVGEVMFAALLKWQDPMGSVLREEFALGAIDSQGKSSLNPVGVNQWLLEPQCVVTESTNSQRSLSRRGTDVEAAKRCLESRLASKSNALLSPERLQWVGLAKHN